MKRILYALLLSGLGLQQFAHAENNKSLYPIRLDAAVLAVLAAHTELANSAMEMATQVEARSEEPALLAGSLEIVKASAQSSGLEASQGRVRLRCVEPGVCMPFYILVHMSATMKAGVPKLQDDAASLPVMLRHGAQVSLLIDSGRLHLRIPATCLQGGTAGNIIHVAALAHGRIYQAAIVDSFTVRGSL